MLEIARELEKAALWFNPEVLIWPGLAAVLLGLFVWLGGLGFRKALVVVVGGITGGLCGFLMGGRSIVPAVLSTIVAAIVAVVFQKIFITMIAVVLAVIIGFVVLTGPYIEKEDGSKSYHEYESEGMDAFLSVSESIAKMKKFAVDFIVEMKRIFLRMPIYNKAIIAALAVVFVAGGYFQQRLVSAFCCAAFGATLISIGMVLLLLYKGAAPISRVYRDQLLYAGIFGAMIVFGMAEQLLLCKRIEGKLARKRGKGKEGKESDWRNK